MTRDERRQAKTQMKNLLPRARRTAAEELANGDAMTLEMGSPLGEMQMPYLRIENAVGVLIYPRFGGWYGDVLLDPDKLPPAAPTALGTPMTHPHKTRDEAEENAVKLLALLIMNSRKPPSAVKDDGRRYFGFFGLWLTIPAEVEQIMMNAVELFRHDPADDPQRWLRRLDEVKREYFGDGEVTGEAFDALPLEARRSIQVVCAIVWGRLNLLRYPNDPEGPPQ